MDDKGLLQLAAKAAGVEIIGNPNKSRWNPLTDDGIIAGGSLSTGGLDDDV